MLAILHAEPRLLIATVITRWLAMLLVVPHGPHIHDNDDTAPETFWRKATTLTNKYRTHASRICVLTDANAQRNTTKTAAAKHAAHFERYLEALQLRDVTNSDEVNTQLTKHITFHPSQGHGLQNDYIAISGPIVPIPGTIRTLDDMVTMITKPDHDPILADVLLLPSQCDVTASRRQPPYARHAIKHNAERIRTALATLPLLSNTIEPTTHAHYLNAQLLEVLQQTCPHTDKAPKRHSHITDRTHHMVQQAADTLRYYTTLGQRLKKHTLARCLHTIAQQRNPAFLQAVSNCSPYRSKLLRQRAMTRKRYDHLHPLVAKAAKDDLAAYATAQTNTLRDHALQGFTKPTHDAAKPFMPYKRTTRACGES